MSVLVHRCLAVLAALALLVPSGVHAANYYVNPSGDDENHGHSAQHPFKTIARAAEVATSGDTVYVGVGRYTDPVYVLGKKNGVSLSSSASDSRKLRFVADSTGVFTSAGAGRVVIGNTPFRVSGSNYVEVEGFVFSGEQAFPVIWEGSYEGKFSKCTFVGGDQSLLMKDGSLLLESCTFTDFSDDAIQVDGAAKLQVRDCSITGSGGHGIDVRKAAVTTIANCTITGNTGDGVHAEVRQDSIPVADIPSTECECTGTSPLTMKQQAYDILDTLSPEDVVYAQVVQSAAGDIQEAMDSMLWRDEWHAEITGGPAVYEQSKEALTKLSALLSDEVDFDIIGDIVKVKHPFVPEITVVGAAIGTSTTNSPVTLTLSVGDQTFEPFGDFDDYTAGDVNDGNNPRTYTFTESFDAEDDVYVTGRSYYAGSIYMTVDKNSYPDHVYTLRNGDTAPGVAGAHGQASAEEFLRPYLDDDGKVTLEDNQVILLFELGTTNLSSSAADFQDLVILLTLKKEITPLTDDELAKIKQAAELLLAANQALADCALDEATAGGGDSGGIADGQGHFNDGLANGTAEKYVDASGDFLSAWEHAKKSTGGVDVDPHAILARLKQPAPPTDWSPVADAWVEVSGSKINTNDAGVNVVTDMAFSASSSEFSENTTWGLSLNGRFKMESCTLSTNGTGGIRLQDMDDGDFGFYSITLTDNVDYGVFMDNCRLTIDDTTYKGWTITGSNHVLGSKGGSLSLDGLTITGGSVAGVYAHQGGLTVSDCTFTGNTYGIAASESEVSIDKSSFTSNLLGLFIQANSAVKIGSSTIEQNTYGLYANVNADMTVADTSLSSNPGWGALIVSPTAQCTFDTCKIASNGNGLFLATVGTGDVSMPSTVITDNAVYGVHFEGCTATVADQATEGWQTVRNGYGISANNSTLTLVNPTIEQATQYGLYSTNSTLTVSGGSVSGVNGAYLENNNAAFTAIGTQFVASSGSNNWGITQKGGNLTARNCLVKGFAGGLTLDSGAGSSAVQHTTVVNATGTGVEVAGGTVSVNNSIVAGYNGSTGMLLSNGTLTHTHNIVNGFTTPFSGTTAHNTESTKTPRFVDAANGDYHLAAGSPAINAGTDLGIVNNTDLDGNARPSFHGYEIGAYEFMSDNASYRVLDWQEKE